MANVSVCVCVCVCVSLSSRIKIYFFKDKIFFLLYRATVERSSVFDVS